jgi:hypothetical protein
MGACLSPHVPDLDANPIIGPDCFLVTPKVRVTSK